jgi:Mg-chelatase subunit ChlD
MIDFLIRSEERWGALNYREGARWLRNATEKNSRSQPDNRRPQRRPQQEGELMTYNLPATRVSPALVIYLIDISASMRDKLNGLPKIEHVNQAIGKVLRRMVQRSTKGEIISPRYRLAMVAYSDQPLDILGGVQTIDQVVQRGKPRLSADATTDTAAAFIVARDLLGQELPNLQGHPAPMVCHLTDGQFTGSDPEPIAQEIMRMSNDDGNVLVENIYIGPELTTQPISDIETWPGVLDVSELKNQYAQKLFDMSSPLPDSYASVINEEGYALRPGSRMLIPGTNYDLIELAFVMSGATPTA